MAQHTHQAPADKQAQQATTAPRNCRRARRRVVASSGNCWGKGSRIIIILRSNRAMANSRGMGVGGTVASRAMDRSQGMARRRDMGVIRSRAIRRRDMEGIRRRGGIISSSRYRQGMGLARVEGRRWGWVVGCSVGY